MMVYLHACDHFPPPPCLHLIDYRVIITPFLHWSNCCYLSAMTSSDIISDNGIESLVVSIGLTIAACS